MNLIENTLGFSGPATPGQDWHAALRPVTSFARILGLFPLSLRGPVGGRKYQTNSASLVYSAVVCISLTISYVMFQRPESTDGFWSRDMVQAVMGFSVWMYVFLMIVVFMTVILAKQEIANIINNMYTQDAALGKLGIRFNYAADFKQSCIRLGVIILPTVILFIYDFYVKSEKNIRANEISPQSNGYVTNWAMLICIHTVRVTDACTFAEILFVLKRKFSAINKNFENMIEETKDSPLQTISTRFRICERIRLIARIHGDLSESALSMNQIFGSQIAIRVVLTFVSLTSGFYFNISSIQNSDDDINVIHSFSWELSTCFDILYMLWACVETQRQANLMGKLIHKLNVHDFDSATNMTIQLFSLQLRHAKIEFTGAGLFSFDRTVISSIVGAMTTYLVIVLQFDMAKP